MLYFQLTFLPTAHLDFESAFGFCSDGNCDACVFMECLDATSASCRIAALSLFANVVVGLNSNVYTYLSLNSLRKLLDVLDAAHAAGDTPVQERAMAVVWNIAASEGESEKIITQARLSLICISNFLCSSTLQLCPQLIKSIVEAAHSSPKALQYSLGVTNYCIFKSACLTTKLLQVLWCITAFEASMDEAVLEGGGLTLAVEALHCRCERTLL